jgi:hypothetical protein
MSVGERLQGGFSAVRLWFASQSAHPDAAGPTANQKGTLAMLRTLSAALLAASMIVAPAFAAGTAKPPVADTGTKAAPAKVDTAHATHHRHHRHYRHHAHCARHMHHARHATHHVTHAKGKAAKPVPYVRSAAPASPVPSRTN